MAGAPRLKVYVRPAGFYDVVVAAPNQAAALKAWGARADLFAEKLAMLETDPTWREKALAASGEVLKKPRGAPEELLSQPAPAKAPASRKASIRRAPTSPPPKPAPDRSALDAAEAAVAQARAQRDRVRADYDRRREALAQEEAEAVEAADSAAAQAEAARERAAAAFARASR